MGLLLPKLSRIGVCCRLPGPDLPGWVGGPVGVCSGLPLSMLWARLIPTGTAFGRGRLEDKLAEVPWKNGGEGGGRG